MPITVTCDECSEIHRVRDDAAGKRLKCKGCGKSLKVEAPDPKEDVIPDDALPGRNLGLLIGLSIGGIGLAMALLAWMLLPVKPTDIEPADEVANKPNDITTSEPAQSTAIAAASQDEIQQSRDKLKTISQALGKNLPNDFTKQAYPAGYSDQDGKLILSWRVAILPALGENELFAQLRLDEPWDSDHNRQLIPKMPAVFKPVRGETKEGHTYYRGFAGADAMFPLKSPKVEKVQQGDRWCYPVSCRAFGKTTDGTSNTFLIAEAAESVPWTKPDELICDSKQPLPKLGGQFDGDFLVLLADGAAMKFSRTVPEDARRTAINPADGVQLSFKAGDASGFVIEVVTPAMADRMYALSRLAAASPHGAASQIKDDANETAFAGMVSEERSVPWTKPDDLVLDDTFQSNEPPKDLSKVNAFTAGAIMFANGSIRHVHLQEGLDPKMFRALFTIAGGEPSPLSKLYSPNFKTIQPTYATPQEHVRHAEARTANKNSLKAIALAFQNYEQTFRYYPPATVYGPDGKPWHSWRVVILPFLGHNDLYEKYDASVPWDHPNNAAVLAQMPPVFRDPLSDKPNGNKTPYLVVTGPGTAFPTRPIGNVVAPMLAQPPTTQPAPPKPVAKDGREPIEYQPFRPDVWKAKNQSTWLFPWEGERIVLLTTTGDLDPKTMAVFVKQLDAGWKLCSDLVGQSPRPFRAHHGKATIAAVPDNSFSGGGLVAYLGMTGIEVGGFYVPQGDYDQVRQNPEKFPDGFFFGIGQNHFVFGNQCGVLSTGGIVALRHICAEAINGSDKDPQADQTIYRYEAAFAKSNATFQEAFAPFGATKPFVLNDLDGKPFGNIDLNVFIASTFLKLRKDNGGDEWAKRFFRHLAMCPTAAERDIDGAKAQLLNWVVAASLAAEKDLSSMLRDRWRFPLAPEVWQSLKTVDWKKPRLTADNVFDALPIEHLLPTVAMTRPGFLTPERRKQNLIVGGTFEDGSGGTWNVNTWRQNKAAATVVSSEAKEGRKSVAVRSPLAADDAMYEQAVAVKPNTRYLLSGWIKTKDVVVVEPNGQRGANLAIEGLNGEVSRSLQGTNDWSYVTLVVDSGQRTNVTVRARLGFHFSTAKGEAWFDDLCLIVIGETPTPLAPQSSVPSKAVVPRDPVSRIVPPAEAVIAAEATKASRPLTNGDFAAGLNGWQVEGDAKEFKTFTLGSQQALTTFGSKKEADTGRLYQCFQVPGDANELRFSLHGGMNMQTTFVALWNGTQLHQRIAAKNDNTPFQVVWNVVPLRGKVITLEIVDNSTTVWGFIGAHGFKLVTQQEAAATTDKRPVRVTQATQDDPLTVSLRGHGHAVLSVAVSPDGKSIASGDLYGSTLVWNVADRKLKFELPGTAGANIVGLAFSPDGKMIATGSGKSVKLWDATNGQELKTLSGHTQLIWSVAFSPDSKRLASGSHDKSVKVWDVAKGEVITTLTGKDSAFLAVAFSPDGKWLAGATSYGGTYVMLWDTRDWREFQRLSPIYGQVWSIAFSPDSQRLVTASDSGRAVVWDVLSGDELLSLQDRQVQRGQDHMESFRGKQMRSVAFNHDGSRIATAADSGQIKIWDAKTGQKLHELSGHAKDARGAVFSPDGKWVAAGGGDSLVKLWTLDGQPQATGDGTIIKGLVDPKQLKSEWEALQGAWRLTNGADFANQLPPEMDIKSLHLVIKGETATVLVRNVVQGFLPTIDPTQTPKAFDMLFAEDIFGDSLSMGIYSLDRDALQITWQPPANGRPKDFKAATPAAKESPDQPHSVGQLPILKFERMQEPLARMDSVFDLTTWQKASRELNRLRIRVQLGRFESLGVDDSAGPGYVGIVDLPVSETDGTVSANVWKVAASVNFIVCNVTRLTDATLRQLTTHPGLSGLVVNGNSTATKEGLALLKNCPHFQGVTLIEVPQTVEILAALAESSDLRIIEINGPLPSPELLAAIARFKNVESLQLRVADLTDDLLIELAKLPNLKKLSLPKSGDFKFDKPNVTDKGLLAVKSMKKLRRLEMFGHGIDNGKLHEINEQLRTRK